MHIIFDLFDIFLHLDLYLHKVITSYGFWTYLILFVVIFCETGLVFTPFFPGDSLLFAAGSFAALGSFDIGFLLLLLSVAAVLGDTVNYFAGLFVGPKIFSKENVRFLNKRYLERTHNFYERHGGKTIIIARFIPIIRTFAPFVAGIGRMRYARFLFFNVFGGISWVFICTLSGYFFGNIPFVKRHFSIVILAIIFISILPGIIGILKERLRKKSYQEKVS